jgi:hypothetical protein
LRILRARSIAQASRFIEESIKFDKSLMRCISLIREVELLSQGFRPDLADMPWDEADAQVEVDDQSTPTLPSGEWTKEVHTPRMEPTARPVYKGVVQTGKTLRSAVASALYLGCTAYIDAIKEVLSHCSELDLQRYFDIYELSRPQAEFGFVMNDDGVGFVRGFPARAAFYGASGAHASVAELRHEFKRLHFLRRAFLCCLLSVCTDGDVTREELDTWSCVVDHLDHTTALSTQLAMVVSKESLVPGKEDAEEIVSSASAPRDSAHAASSPRSKHPALFDMSLTLQHLQARIALLAEQDEPPEEWGGGDLSKSANDTLYTQLGEDINRLQHLFDRLRHGSQASKSRSHAHHRQDTMLSTATTMVADDCGSVYSSTVAADDLHSPRSSVVSFSGKIRTEAYQNTMTILEAIVDREDKARSNGPVLNRAERIALMNDARKAESQRRVVSQQRDKFVLELGNVLNNRSRRFKASPSPPPAGSSTPVSLDDYDDTI